MSEALPVTEFHPPVGPEREAVEAPIAEVTLFEDRGRVRRRLTATLSPGQNRLVIPSVSPVMQDVSLRAAVVAGAARVADVRARRSLRVLRARKPDAIRGIDEELRAIILRQEEAADERRRVEARHGVVTDMLAQGASEIPQDVAWGHADPTRWSETFGSLFARARDLRRRAWDTYHAQLDLVEAVQHARARRAVASRRDDSVIAWVALDLVADEAGEVTVDLEYVVPCALWRPIHSAKLQGDSLEFTCQAAVWQNTGEDWDGVALVCSTARSSLGVEPPRLSDDLLTAQKKAKETVVAAREVAVQSAGIEGIDGIGGGAGGGESAVELAGVDDGGDIQSLRAEGLSTVPADGRPCFLPLFRFTAPAEVSRVLMAELDPKVFLRSVQANTGGRPILAGPVELIRASGLVGWTSTLFVAPGQRFELGFGPQDDMRVTRDQQRPREKTDPVKKTRMKDTRIRLYLSNLGDEARSVVVTERLPVSEIAEVEVSVVENSAGGSAPDKNGFVTWTVALGAYERSQIALRYRLTIAPGVKGL